MEAEEQLVRVASLRLAAIAASFVLGCGGGSGGANTSPASTPETAEAGASGNYLPLSVGTNWTYNITSVSGATGQGTVAVEAADTAPNAAQPALRVHTVLLDGGWA